MNTNKITRLEVIDATWRAYVNRNISSIELSPQDNGKTLKIFINNSSDLWKQLYWSWQL